MTSFTGCIIPLVLYYFGLRWSRASVGGIAELAFPILAIFVNDYFLGFGLSNMQIIGAIILFSVVSLISYVNKLEYEKEKTAQKIPEQNNDQTRRVSIQDYFPWMGFALVAGEYTTFQASKSVPRSD